ncbi:MULTISPECIES: hypothetical protein [Robiginitalea]|nr:MULTISPECIES: hypothetical protein [Robiginitalea]MDC6354045.1 hypothetical protein [Robiginitalea sp. PM2]MDC6374312.1 hypothetical protein [Robiginitalea sp. SP8]
MKRLTLHLLAFMAVLTLGTSPLGAQTLQEYSGPLEVGSYKGRAQYQYRVDSGDTILDGAFRFSRSNLQSLLQESDTSFSVSGAFSGNNPRGPWQFRFGTYRSDSITDVVGLQYTLKVSGVQHEASGTLVSGRPDGQWVHTVSRITGSEVARELFRSSVSYRNGVPQQSFRLRDTTDILVGRFLRNGLAHDTWTLYSDAGAGVGEEWVFDEGRLRYIDVSRGASSERIPVWSQSFANSRAIDLDARFLKLIQLNTPTTDISSGKVNRLLTRNNHYYSRIDTILSALGNSDYRPGFRVRVPWFPLNPADSTRVSRLRRDIPVAARIARELLDNAGLKILERSNSEVGFLLEVTRMFKSDYIDPSESLLEYIEMGILEYVPRDQLISGLWAGSPPGRIGEVPTDTTTESQNYRDTDEVELGTPSNTLEYLANLVGYARGNLERIEELLTARLNAERQEQEFARTEERLIVLIDDLEALADSLVPGSTVQEHQALVAIRRSAENRLRVYSSMDSAREKLAYGTDLLGCLGALDSLAKEIYRLPERRQAIQEAYTDQVWNPFTATLMEESVKKRITTAYTDVLIPETLRRIDPEISCEYAEAAGNFLKSAFSRIVKLRDEDTSRLERRLRRENDPAIVAERLELAFPEKNLQE